ncbi:facilitated trehalose transporter Tret1-like [Tribolium madens]|uniref:facilitated trehalose transporter Tret1-like n=1 Tax=Tribolium madens TaxID=41895 RepID=UPI001CF76358|nr:facilitated trehalose transporter Tret1-like [Tribolium madens]
MAKTTNFYFYYTACVVNLIAFTAGLAYGLASPLLPRLNGSVDPDNNPLDPPATPSEESLIASLVSLGAIFGPLFAGLPVDQIGRKKTLLIVALPMITSFLIMAFAHSVVLFYIARLIMGVGAGSIYTILPMYLGEISEDHNRGTLGCLMSTFIASGLLFVYTVGPFVTIRSFCLMCLVPLGAFLVLFGVWAPETPQFLALKGDEEGLKGCLSKLRSVGEVDKEILRIKESLNRNRGGLRELFQSRASRKGLVITVGFMVLQQLAGINAVNSYLHTIFDATGSGLSPEISSIIIGTVQVFTTMLTSSLVDKSGRRILLLLSVIGSGVSLVSLGLYFHLKTNNFQVDTLSWLPVMSLVVFIISFNIGLGPIPWAVMAELFPPNVKSIASTFSSIVCFIGAFTITLFFPSLAEVLGMAQAFWFFATFCALGAVFIYFILPETKGKSLQEIQTLLDKNFIK